MNELPPHTIELRAAGYGFSQSQIDRARSAIGIVDVEGLEPLDGGRFEVMHLRFTSENAMGAYVDRTLEPPCLRLVVRSAGPAGGAAESSTLGASEAHR
jgi:hypothetical protein